MLHSDFQSKYLMPLSGSMGRKVRMALDFFRMLFVYEPETSCLSSNHHRRNGALIKLREFCVLRYCTVLKRGAFDATDALLSH